ncbi:MAG: carboxynorspermidine decarboxylase [Lachnospiraceae bacterium]|nr:carboxynorspermidine decarboxylase [Lachnospiraceae bacterium]
MKQSEIFAGLEKYDVPKIFEEIKTPAYVIDEEQLIANGQILKEIQDRTGCKILLAQKAFSNYNMYKTLAPYLAGTEASGLYEARLGAEEMPEGEVHVFCGAYRDEDFEELLKYADHIVFNSVAQLKRFGSQAKDAGKSVGIRINPEVSTQDGHDIYDPCGSGSRLGVTLEQWQKHMTAELIELLEGIHFHTLCEQDSDALETTLKVVEERFGAYFKNLKWINFGGGHHITRRDYDVDRLIKCIERIQKKYGVTVYLEPGEACALNAGYMVTKVLDVVENDGKQIAILDSSAACHMPDVIEMPYMPPLMGAMAHREGATFNGETGSKAPDSKNYPYILAGPTCLAGDVIGTYFLDRELSVGDTLVFGDMAIYTTCKNNTFNGMPLPDICCLHKNGEIKTLVSFGYESFKERLGR